MEVTQEAAEYSSPMDRYSPIDCAVFGAGGHGVVLMDILEAAGAHSLTGFVDDAVKKGGTVEGYPVLGGEGDLSLLREQGLRNIIVAIGDNRVRQEKIGLVLSLGFTLINAVHPRATVSPRAELGRGVAIMAGAVVNPASVLEDGAIVNTCASVDHHNRIGSCVHIAPGSHLGGEVTVGERTLIGIGATVLRGVRIGKDCLVTCGSVVTKDLDDGQSVKGRG
jgi:UDP-perosamine 4-acetyltransferase